ncbi:MAG: hypothetical protein ABWY33_09725 [Cellulomonas sp.]
MSDRPGVRGDLLLHPVALVSLGVLLLNDHVLKAAAPGWVTGKLSDLAGLTFFPFLLLAARHVLLRTAPSVGAALAGAAVTGATFAAVKLSTAARQVYSDVVGVLRFPVDHVVLGVRTPVDVGIAADASDVWAVAACVAVVLVLRRQRSRLRDVRPDAVAADA